MEIRFGRSTYKSTFIRYANKKCVRNFSISVRRRAQVQRLSEFFIVDLASRFEN